jgi:hypothetical protein
MSSDVDEQVGSEGVVLHKERRIKEARDELLLLLRRREVAS